MEEIAALEAGIAALDKAVMDATKQRQQENADYKDLMASDTAAKQLLRIAKNRLNKFYNPRLYQPPAKTELTAEGRIEEQISGSAAPTPPPGGIANTGVSALGQVSAHAFGEVAPPPPPETFGAYTKKTEASTGVIEMIDLLIADLDKELAEAETTEKDAQVDYAELMQDSAEKRTADSKSLTDKVAAKTDAVADLAAHKSAKADATKELAATLKYIAAMHAECDWLLKYHEVRKEARNGEIQSLVDAKAVLGGADYSLLQRVRESTLSLTTAPCPSTTLYYTDAEDAAGTTIWSGPVTASPGTCYPVAASGITAYKICGPGNFVASRMSCDRHDYKAVEVEHPGSAFTEGVCKEYSAAGSNVEGYIGSFSFSCSATER